MITVEIPIKDRKNPPALKFPECCVNCGAPKEVVLPLKLHMGVQKGRQMVMLDLPAPLCRACERKERGIAYVTLVPFVAAGLIFFVIGFVPVWLVTPDGTTPQTMGFSATVGALAGLLTGLIGGSLVEIVSKSIFVPVYGRLLWRRPLTVLSFINDSEHLPGLAVRFADRKTTLSLTFENEQVAKEFQMLNSREKR
jgi:hypothetical protein